MPAEITVQKADLLKTLEENREKHRSIFLEAQEVYREKVIAELDQMLADAREGRRIRRQIHLPEPEDYTTSFTRAIEMLGWEIGDTVTLSEREFAEYVQNEWGWNQRFAANTASYTTQVQ